MSDWNDDYVHPADYVDPRVAANLRHLGFGGKMTLEEAVAVLNERRHRGVLWEWAERVSLAVCKSDDGLYMWSSDNAYNALTGFEVIAVAQAYRRQNDA